MRPTGSEPTHARFNASPEGDEQSVPRIAGRGSESVARGKLMCMVSLREGCLSRLTLSTPLWVWNCRVSERLPCSARIQQRCSFSSSIPSCDRSLCKVSAGGGRAGGDGAGGGVQGGESIGKENAGGEGAGRCRGRFSWLNYVAHGSIPTCKFRTASKRRIILAFLVAITGIQATSAEEISAQASPVIKN